MPVANLENAVTEPLVYISPCILPHSATVLRDGAIVMDGEVILDVGPRERIVAEWSQARIRNLKGVLLPPLINGHMHSELSFMEPVTVAEEKGMVGWVEELLKRRRLESPPPRRIALAAENALTEQQGQGVVLVADICNSPAILPSSPTALCRRYPIHEVLAPTRERTRQQLEEIQHHPPELAISPHAPYSTSAELITRLKRRALANGHIFSIHTAESSAEHEFVTTGGGAFRDFLIRNGSWDSSLIPAGGNAGCVDYLNTLGVLDETTLCVHCVHVSEVEIALLAEKGSKVCLCPTSNDHIGNGKAPLPLMLEYGLLPAIGTDSRASNEMLDMWREMRVLHQQNREVATWMILSMATRGGAEALGRGGEFGTLEPGKKPVFLEILMHDSVDMATDPLFDELVTGRGPQRIRWFGPNGEL